MNSMKFTLALIGSLCFQLTNAQTVDWTKKANPVLNQINSVAFSSNGQKVLSGTNCHPASIRIFDVTSGTMNWDYTVGSSYMCIMGVTFSSNTNYIAAIEEFGNIFIFDNTGALPVIIDTINTGTSYGFSTAISPANDKVAVGCSNGKMKIYNIPSGALAYDINAHPSWVTTVAYSPNGNYIVTGGNDDKVKIWSNAGTLLHTCTGHTGDITSVKVTPDNNFVISSSKDDKIKIWNISNGTLVKTINGHTKDVNGIDISPDGTKIVSASSDSTCKIWDFLTGNLHSTFGVTDSGAVISVAWSPNGDKIITGNIKSDAVLWSVPTTLSLNQTVLNDNFLIFPNPTQNTLNIELPFEPIIYQINIYNEFGQLEKMYSNIKTRTVIIDTDGLSNGVYFIEVQTHTHKLLNKFIINK